MYTNVLYVCIINMKLRHEKKKLVSKKFITKNSIYLVRYSMDAIYGKSYVNLRTAAALLLR